MTNEPTTGEIVLAIRLCEEGEINCTKCPFANKSCGDLNLLAADRLESQEQTIAKRDGVIEAQNNVLEIAGQRNIENLTTISELTASRDRMTDAVAELTMKVGELTARAESAEREQDAAYSNHPWVRIEGRDYFVQVKRFDPANNMVVIADHKFGWHSVRYEKIREWRGLPQEGEGK